MFLLFNIIFCLFTLRYELEKKSSLVTRAFSAKSCTRDTDSLHSCTRLRLVQEMACLYHSCKILPRKHSYPNLIPILISCRKKEYGQTWHWISWSNVKIIFSVTIVYPKCCSVGGDVLSFIGRHAASLFSTHNIQHFHLIIYFFIEVIPYCYWLSECECEPLGSCCISMLALGSASELEGFPAIYP